MTQDESRTNFIDVVEIFPPTKAPNEDTLLFALRLVDGRVLKLALSSALASALATRLLIPIQKG